MQSNLQQEGAVQWQKATEENAMMTQTQTREAVSFGPFSLVPNERLLTRDGKPVDLGTRALDIVLALVARPQEVVGKDVLLRAVWPGVTVEESSLRFHIAGLRKVLGDGKDGARYITTLPGRGYCFVAPVARSSDRGETQAPAARAHETNLPARPIGMLGRDDDVARLSSLLGFVRLVTVVGAGGIGKTTVAAALGHHLMQSFSGSVLFVDLGMLSDPKLVATAVASMLGLSVQAEDATPALIAYLREKPLLLILDTCEHLIEAVATLAARIFAEAPRVQILATSRETLQVEGEHVYRLEPLACPPDDPGLTAAVARTFPATQLFVERAVASGARLDLSDAEAAIVVAICRKLDGVALAIELAARRVGSYGLDQTAQLLDQRLTLLWVGPRTAPARQKTLQATLDWSYGLLSEVERIVLRRLAIFVGHFSLDAALAVATGDSVDHVAVFTAIDSLVAKSMVATRPVGAMMRYRLLDTTRAYALEMSLADAEFPELAVRHATYYRRWLEQAATDWPALSSGADRTPYFAGINNVRAALEWCFGTNGDLGMGVGLAAAAAPFFWAMSLLPECHRWSQQALQALGEAGSGSSEEMHLQAGLGTALMNMHGGSDAARAALERSLAVAKERGDAPGQMGLLGMLHMFHLRGGEYRTALSYIRRSSTVAESSEDPAAIALAHCMSGRLSLVMGDLGKAQTALDASQRYWSRPQPTSTIYLAADRHYRPGIALARTLWLRGFPTQAVERAERTIDDVKDHPVSLTGALAWAIGGFLWAGEVDRAEAHTDQFIADAASHALGPNVAVGLGLKGQLAICRDHAEAGVTYLRSSLEKLHAARYRLMNTEFSISLAQGLAAMGRNIEAAALIDRTIAAVEANGDMVYLPELLRVKAGLPSIEGHAEVLLTHALDLSRRQGARAWELRVATDLARHWTGQNRADAARALLQPVLDGFTEGLDTADLKTAKRILESIP
jgi:predicted ATPase/DNA-binding winged helix-turn-helix (wHTH) protein